MVFEYYSEEIMRDSILLITKDALCKEYLPIYGNKYWAGKTPNIDELAEKGTVFNRHYTAAPSTVMAFRSMVTGKFAHEQPYSKYEPKEVEGADSDLFEIAKKQGYQGHLIWDSSWIKMVLRYGNCYGKETVIHNMDNIKQGVGCHYNHNGKLVCNEDKIKDTISRIVNEVEGILNNTEKAFVWIHLPHVLNGRIAYGGDIDAFDELIGCLRKLFSDDNIFISADHGNMNGYNGKYCYGFDVNTSAIEIPLIAPRIEGKAEWNDITSNVDIKTLIFNREVTKRSYVFSDCTYYAQPHRKLAIIKDDFAYIYNKANKTEELYDLKYDRNERVNLLQTEGYDTDRKILSPIRDYYFSPYWDSVNEIVEPFRKIKDDMWRDGSKADEMKEKVLQKVKLFVVKLLVKLKK